MTQAIPIPQPDNPIAFPIYVYEHGKELPATGTYYVIAGNGLWLHKDTGMVFATIRAEGIGHLDTLIPDVGWRLPVLPVGLMLRAVLFFRKVFKRHHAESALLIFWSKEKQEFALVCPNQEVHYGGIHYNPDQSLEGYLQVGTIHSHCDFSASHSHTDRHDEMDFDGLHITVGNLTERNFSLVSSVVVNGQRAMVDPTTKIEGIVGAESIKSWFSEDSSYGRNLRFRFNLENTKEELKAIYQSDNEFVEKEWLPQVRARTFLATNATINRPNRTYGGSRGVTTIYRGYSDPLAIEAPAEIEKEQDNEVVQQIAAEQLFHEDGPPNLPGKDA